MNGGHDRPLEVIRIGYTPQPSSNGPYHLDEWGGPHPMILHTDWRGMVDRATTARGRPMPCQLPLQCPQIRFPAATYKAYNQSADLVARQTWYGSLIEEKTDDSGLMYMRNRYYNPTTGQFTQEDPIGLAGGLSAYGFANGDPATYNDPFGLSASDCQKNPGLLCRIGHWLGNALFGADEIDASSKSGALGSPGMADPVAIGSGLAAGKLVTAGGRALVTGGTSRLIGVPERALSRATARLAGLRVGDKHVIRSVEAFGSRAGSTFRGRGPTASSDLDFLVELNMGAFEGRSQRWIQGVLQSIRNDFQAETGIELNMLLTHSARLTKQELPGTPFIQMVGP